VAVTTVKRAVVQQSETGSRERQPIPGGPRRIGKDQEAVLRARLEAAPDVTVLEHCAWWAAHPAQQLRMATRWRAVRDEEARAAWRAAVATRDPAQFIVVDASGTLTSLTRLSGWAPHEGRASGSVPRTHGQKTTLVAALAPDGLREPWLMEGGLTTRTFAWDIRELVAPRLPPGQVVVLENPSAHRAASICEALAHRQCELLFLPPSSADFTPIEQAFSKLKAILGGLGARTHEALQEVIRLAIEAITPDDAAGWFAHAGYPLPAKGT
jgi:transposase